jgi:hypothetical protein
MDARFEMGESFHQPKFEAVAMRDDERFVLTVRLPSGEVIDVPLGPLPPEMPLPPDDAP